MPQHEGAQEFLRVKNWERYQHYKSGRMSEADRKAAGKEPLPWFVVYHKILRDYPLMTQTLATRAIAFELMAVARLHFNEITTNLDELAHDCWCTKKELSGAIDALLQIGFIERVTDPSRHRLDTVKTCLDYKTVTGQDSNRTEQHCPPTGEPRMPFDQFWKAYPRKTAKKRAKEAWSRLKVTTNMWATMVAAIETQKESEQWQDPRLIPHPATWLNGHRWEDEPPHSSGGQYFNPLPEE